MVANKLTPDQLRVIGMATITASCLSAAGTSFILVTFILVPAFNKPLNRLFFYVSFANLLSDVATGLAQLPRSCGPDSSLCRFQAFAIQLAHPCDLFWSLAMAFNVYLVFFRRFDTHMLRKLEPLYMVLCYGTPFVPALTYLFIHDKKSGYVYGDGLIWCWIRASWMPLRFATLYAIAWFCIAVIAAIYISVGTKLLFARARIRRLNRFDGHENFQPNIRVTQEVTVESTTTSSKNSTTASAQLHSWVDDDEKAIPPRSMTSTNSTQLKNGPPTPQSPQDDLSSMVYFRFAGLYFLALCLTWAPPTVNRIYGAVYPDDQVFGLNLVHAIAISIQGLWNAVIYISSSIPACLTLWENFTGKVRSALGWRR